MGNATNQFQIAFLGIGPTESRIGYVAINTVLFSTGTGLFSWAVPMAGAAKHHTAAEGETDAADRDLISIAR